MIKINWTNKWLMFLLFILLVLAISEVFPNQTSMSHEGMTQGQEGMTFTIPYTVKSETGSTLQETITIDPTDKLILSQLNKVSMDDIKNVQKQLYSAFMKQPTPTATSAP